MSKLSVVATPIGNLGDITLRALETLKQADFIICEDTRVTKRLLSHYDINKPTISYHSHSEQDKKDEILAILKNGSDLALVTDAGTPGISDPGLQLVSYLRDQLKQEIISGVFKIESIPGPSALTASISIAGVSCADFLFLGFLPHKKGRETLFKEIAQSERTVIFYESTHRILKALDSLEKFCPSKKITITRELTKIFEEVVSGNAMEVKDYFNKNPEKVKGEFVVLVSTY